jgi:glutamate-ammonia-ligase adenylyltransferase
MAALDVKDLLLASRLEPQQAAALLAPYGLTDIPRADANLQAIAGNPGERLLLAEILGTLLGCVADSAVPDQALNYLERFVKAAGNRSHLFAHLQNSSQAIEILAKSLGGSSYMAEILIRDPHHFYWVTDPQLLAAPRRRRAIQKDLIVTLKALHDETQQLDYIRALKRREMLHIGVRDLLRLSTVEETLSALSVLAETLISAAHWICATALRREYSIPSDRFRDFTVLAMGKLGGGELNFSSDVDLMYVYASDTESAPSVSAADFFRKLSRKITSGLNAFTGEGYVYRVDLRLRPEGDAGNLADSLDGYLRYYRTRMGAWERLALLKAWPVAGSRTQGRRFLDMVPPVIFDAPFEREAVDSIRDMKERIDLKAYDRSPASRNVKLGAGGIREIELIVQALQVSHGGRLPQIRSRSTLKALEALRACGLVSEAESESLRGAYLFLRDVENKLQMVHDAQTHSLPLAPEELTACARLLGYTDEGSSSASSRFRRDLDRHSQRVNEIFTEVIGSPDLHRLRRQA